MRSTGRANLIKSTMTQAILYGSHPEVRVLCASFAPDQLTPKVQNPLYFSFPPDVDEEALMSGAEQLSGAIMESGTLILLDASQKSNC